MIEMEIQEPESTQHCESCICRDEREAVRRETFQAMEERLHKELVVRVFIAFALGILVGIPVATLFV